MLIEDALSLSISERLYHVSKYLLFRYICQVDIILDQTVAMVPIPNCEAADIGDGTRSTGPTVRITVDTAG